MRHINPIKLAYICLIAVGTVQGFSQPTTRKSFIDHGVFGIATTALVGLDPSVASAVVASDQAKPKEFVNVGTQAPAPDGESAFVTLENGVKYKDFRVGSGDETVQKDSQAVMIQCTGRLLNLNGVIFYSTKNNNPDGFGPIPLTVNLGKGEAVPGLER